MNGLLNDLSSFVASMVALSIGVERVVEIFKNLWAPLRTDPPPDRDPKGEKAALRRLSLHVISTATGAVIVKLIDPHTILPTLVSGTDSQTAWAWSIFIGLISSGGSAFWNHALDIIGAVKSTKESVAKELNAGQQAVTSPSPNPTPALNVSGA